MPQFCELLSDMITTNFSTIRNKLSPLIVREFFLHIASDELAGHWSLIMQENIFQIRHNYGVIGNACIDFSKTIFGKINL